MKVKEGQSLIDIAVYALGSAEAAYELAVQNGLSISDDLVPGQELAIPSIVNRSVVQYLSDRKIIPATQPDLPTDLLRLFFEELPLEFI